MVSYEWPLPGGLLCRPVFCNFPEDDIECYDYIYIPECSHNNLSEDDIATAIENGSVQVLSGTQNDTSRISETLICEDHLIGSNGKDA